MRSKTLAIMVVALALTIGGAQSARASHDASPEGGYPQEVDQFRACGHPCPGFQYDLHYRIRDGRINSVTGWQVWDPEAGGPVLQEGEAEIDVTHHPELLQIRGSLSRYYVDLESGEVKQRPDETVQGVGTLPPLTDPILAGPMIGFLLGAAAVARRWRRRARASTGGAG